MGAHVSLEDLEAFLVVARTRSIGAAARDLDTTQPNLSRRMAALERRLGLRLLSRTRQGSELTDLGQAVADWAARLLTAEEEFSRSVRAIAGGPVGPRRLDLAASMTIAEHYAPAWLGALRRAHPEVEPHLRIGNSADVAGWVRDGTVELGFLESPEPPTGLRHRCVGEDTVQVAVRPDDPWATRTCTPEELAATALLLREPGSGTRETLVRALAARGLLPVAALELTSNSALCASALAGLGPVVLSSRALAAEVDAGRLVPVAVTGLTLTRPLTAVVRHTAVLSDPARYLLEGLDGGA